MPKQRFQGLDLWAADEIGELVELIEPSDDPILHNHVHPLAISRPGFAGVGGLVVVVRELDHHSVPDRQPVGVHRVERHRGPGQWGLAGLGRDLRASLGDVRVLRQELLRRLRSLALSRDQPEEALRRPGGQNGPRLAHEIRGRAVGHVELHGHAPRVVLGRVRQIRFWEAVGGAEEQRGRRVRTGPTPAPAASTAPRTQLRASKPSVHRIAGAISARPPIVRTPAQRAARGPG